MESNNVGSYNQRDFFLQLTIFSSFFFNSSESFFILDVFQLMLHLSMIRITLTVVEVF
jgi:hypothetical protein